MRFISQKEKREEYMKRRRQTIQGAIVGMWLGAALFNGATVWSGDSGSSGTTQRFRGTVQGAAPQVTAKQSAPGTSMRFAVTPPASGVSKEDVPSAGSTLRFASPISSGVDQSVQRGMVDVKENEEERGTFN
jgi:hypothetical protein